MRNSTFICFIGIDGSGKTTLAKMLIRMMDERGIKGKYVYNTYRSFLLRPLMSIAKAFLFRGKTISKNYAEYTNMTKKVFKWSFLSTMYQYSVLLDYLFQTLFKVGIPRIFGKNVICDRYLYDVVVNIAVESDYSNDRIESMLRKISYLLPKPNLLFLVDLPEEIAYQRKDDVPTIEYLKKRREIYLDIGKEYGIVILDGSKKLKDLECEIEEKVFR